MIQKWLLHGTVAEKLRTGPPDGWREREGENLRRSRVEVHGRLAAERPDRWERLFDAADVPAVVVFLLQLDEDTEERRALYSFARWPTDEEHSGRWGAGRTAPSWSTRSTSTALRRRGQCHRPAVHPA